LTWKPQHQDMINRWTSKVFISLFSLFLETLKFITVNIPLFEVLWCSRHYYITTPSPPPSSTLCPLSWKTESLINIFPILYKVFNFSWEVSTVILWMPFETRVHNLKYCLYLKRKKLSSLPQCCSYQKRFQYSISIAAQFTQHCTRWNVSKLRSEVFELTS